MTAGKIRVLLFSTLFPSAARPNHGLFVETRLRELLKTDNVDVRVVAPVPWFFSANAAFGEYAKFASTPKSETREGVSIVHPRYFLPPRIGMTIAPLLLALGAIPGIRRLRNEGFDFDLIDAHYYYPDGVAAALLAAWFSRPFVVTARGSDITLIPRFHIPRKWILWAAGRARASITVCKALADELQNLGAEPAKIKVLRNGVDLTKFHPVPRDQARAALGWSSDPYLLSVGNLVDNKGHHLIIEALLKLPAFKLVIVGAGPNRSSLGELARKLGLEERVHFAGVVPQPELARYYSAADISVLASEREGWANVLLESMACGTPVVATRIWGTPEVVASREAGRLTTERSAQAIAAAINELIADYPDRDRVRQYAAGFGWDSTSAGQLRLFRDIRQVET
jgi:glycosyltransferase involved in cell wall biosynthesis